MSLQDKAILVQFPLNGRFPTKTRCILPVTKWLAVILVLALLPCVAMARATDTLYEQLIEAAKSGDLALAGTLLDEDADVNAKDQDGWTALKIAQQKGHSEIVELLKAHGAKE